MKKNMWYTLALTAAAVSALGLAAAAEDEPVTLTVLAGQSTTDAGIEDMIDEALAEKYPNITLEWECVDWGNDFQPKMQQYMQSGLPDIMIGKAQDVATYAPQGILAEIGAEYLDAGLDAARENVTIDGYVCGKRLGSAENAGRSSGDHRRLQCKGNHAVCKPYGRYLVDRQRNDAVYDERRI